MRNEPGELPGLTLCGHSLHISVGSTGPPHPKSFKLKTGLVRGGETRQLI